MTLAARLVIAFGFVAFLATALVGVAVRESSRQIIEAGFDRRIEAAASGVSQELAWEAASMSGLLAPLCADDTIVDKAHVDLDRAKGNTKALEPGAWIRFRVLVPQQARALKLDSLVMASGDGVILGATDLGRIGTKDARLAALFAEPEQDTAPRLRAGEGGKGPTIEVSCALRRQGITVGLVGARVIEPTLSRISRAYGVSLTPIDPNAAVPAPKGDEVVKPLNFSEIKGLRVVASVPRTELREAIVKLDRAIAMSGLAAIAAAMIVAIILARSLSRPIVALARETREVVSGKPAAVKGRGGREIAMLAQAFNETIDELTSMRKRVAATERIAARREVARQIAHEIKNPLAPIRAAVETLRRLRARDDPAFDEYFEEATSTVLGEVHRIANIVTEFTRFARLPPPSLASLDLAAIAKPVVSLHASAPDGEASPAAAPRAELVAEPIPAIMADKDQMVQVLTNLIQNGLEAASAVRPDPRVVVTIGPVAGDRGQVDKVRVVVRDNGPGVPDAMLARLFEPYATTKEKGTGLGLAIVQRIVFEHGGEISYRKATKGGAVFEIILPVGGPPLLERPPSMESTGSQAPQG